jgi:hypothetical protein
MKITQDAYGRQLLAQYISQTASAEIIERDDHYIDTGSDPGMYFRDYNQWSPLERRAIILTLGYVAGLYVAAVSLVGLLTFMITGAWLLLIGVYADREQHKNDN